MNTTADINRTPERMRALKACVVIPTYNNANTLTGVIEDAAVWCGDIIVVDDGSTDGTQEILRGFGERITTVAYSPNRGKGVALRNGFRKARQMGFDYALTMDSDGQHFAADIPLFLDAAECLPEAMVIGSRKMENENMPRGNTFANKFSNFWFAMQTCRRLPDTQTGYRLYPLAKMDSMRFFTNRYEAELEMMVRMAWRGVEIVPVGISVYYAPAGERVTHFRKGKDFMRISLLNTLLCFAALLWGYPSMIIRKLTVRRG